MKRLLLCSLGFTTFAFGQVSDSVSLNVGYANESYYSFANGEVANVDNQNWHLAFELSAWGGAIRLNRKQAELYDSEEVVADWSSTIDTTGQFAVWDQHMNGYDWWDEGAVNNAADAADPFDMGWGDYNSVTHQILGSRIFVLKFNNGDCKKFMIESLIGGVYMFKHADLDGSNEVTQTITKGDYTDKNFVYYDVLSDQITDREPANTSWDVVFTNFVLELAPGYFGGVTGALHNNGVVVSEIDNEPVAISTYNNVWDTTIASIGYDWKTFNMTTYQYDIEDSLTYFVQTSVGDIWKLVFTGFGGSSTGKIYFTKEQVEFASIPAYEGANLEAYPNPANTVLTVNYAHDVNEIRLINMSGQVVIHQTTGLTSINVSSVDEGVYFLQVKDDAGNSAMKRVIIKH
tara:strand:+ start:1533 stop:2741 length:1209 start_codon:yes stop_codon:yes gene_type:complete